MKFSIESTKNQALNPLKCKLKEKKWFQAMITFNPMKKSNQSFLFSPNSSTQGLPPSLKLLPMDWIANLWWNLKIQARISRLEMEFIFSPFLLQEVNQEERKGMKFFVNFFQDED